ncbi:MAG: hypothetical protein SH850_03535 [Planctomycetaceae bacterium]|nr:hypothetical protein [Planctomycetaceae bacterium]
MDTHAIVGIDHDGTGTDRGGRGRHRLQRKDSGDYRHVQNATHIAAVSPEVCRSDVVGQRAKEQTTNVLQHRIDKSPDER